jgi:ADP-heptose:LPS heptosyltransferase
MARGQARKFKKILIVKPSSLGDIVHSLPFLYSIRKCSPDAELHWVVARGFEDILEGHPMIEKLWVINKDQWKKLSQAGSTIKELRALSTSLKKEGYDLAVDLQGLLRSGMITMATGSKMRLGFQEAREGGALFYTHSVEGGRGAHAVRRYLKIASSLGCDTSRVRFPMPEAPFPMPFDGEYVVIVPGARWRTKRWPAERFARLAAKLPLRSVIVGGKSDVRIAKRIVEIKGARFAVTNDSGPMHFAAAHRVPVFAIFGPTSPAHTGPYGKRHTIISSDIDCAPCFKKRCRDIKCMESIPVKKVLDAVLANIKA